MVLTSESDDGGRRTPDPPAGGPVNAVPESPNQEGGAGESAASASMPEHESGEKTGESKKNTADLGIAPYAPTVGAKWSEDDEKVSAPYKSRYRDFSRIPPEPEYGRSGAKGKSKEPTFPVKLHMILSNPEFQDIVCWLPHGRSWRILQQRAFEERIIPLFFRHGRYSSFARQVNGWGFKRVTHGSDYNSYYHEMFLRGLPHLCHKMRRLTSKDSAARRDAETTADDSDFTPDFYAISRAFPVPDNPFPALPQRPVLAANPLLAGAGMNPSFAGINPALGGINPAMLASLEASMVERQQRADLVERLNAIEAANVLSAQQRQNPFLVASLAMRQGQGSMVPMNGGLTMNPMTGMPAPASTNMPQQALSNPLLMSSHMAGGRFGNNNTAALEAELMAARAGGNSDLALWRALNANGGVGGFNGSFRGGM